MIYYQPSILNIPFQFRFIMILRSSACCLHNISSLYRQSVSHTRYSPHIYWTFELCWDPVNLVTELCTPVSSPVPSSTAGSTSGWRCWTTRTTSRWASRSTRRRPWGTSCSPSCQRWGRRWARELSVEQWRVWRPPVISTLPSVGQSFAQTNRWGCHSFHTIIRQCRLQDGVQQKLR